MMFVRLTRDMRPHTRGDDLVITEELAKKLIKDGDADNPRTFPEGKPLKTVVETVKERLGMPAGTYKTKGK